MEASRRDLLKSGIALSAGELASPTLAQDWTPSLRYPDPSVHTIDKRFDKCRVTVNANIERLYTGCRWTEGPVWIGDQHLLIWSDHRPTTPTG